jgi:outer membrane protein
MKQVLKYSFFVFAFFIATSLFAQKKWTLEECITYALQNNIQIKREFLQTQKSKDDKLSAYMSFAPSLGASFSHNIQIGRSFSTNIGEFVTNPQVGSGGIGGTFDLFQGLTKWNYLAQTKFDLLASLEGVEELKRNVSLNIAAKYLEVLYASENYNLALNRVDVSDQQAESSLQQYELGKISNGDYLQIKSQAIAEKVQLTSARNTLDMSKLELAQMLELQTVEGFEIFTDNIIIQTDTVKLGLKQYYDEALTTMPSIKRASYNKKSADKRYLIALGNSLPTISIGYQMSSYYSDQATIRDTSGNIIRKYPGYSYLDQSRDNIRKYLSFDVSIPIFGKLQNYVRISKAKIDKLDASFAVEQEEKNLLKGVQQAYADARGEFFRYKSMMESEASYKEIFEMNKEKFNLGMVNAVEYGLARNNHIKSQGDLLHAKYSYLLKLKILDFYRGVPITL